MSKTTRQPQGDELFSAHVVTLTPAMAEDLLSRNTRNRKVSRANYLLVKRAVENGEWRLNGEAIKVSVNGYILDGQHRCMAVAETGVSIRTLLIEGLPDDTQDTMDTGKSRSLADILAIRGEPNTNALAACIKRFLISENHGFTAAFSSTTSSYPVTNHECLEWFAKNRWVTDYVLPGRVVARNTSMGAAGASFLMRTFDVIDREDSEFFWSRLVDGLELSEGNPIYVLRKSLRLIGEDTRGERNQRYIAALVIKAWNAYRAGDSISLLKFRVGGAKPEAFPEPK